MLKLTNILKGFNEKLILPIGGGKNGLQFGSYLASPTLFESAYSFGSIST
jgi:hypothetical protein